MGTKALARTIIEGGRARRNVWERRYSSQAERAAVRAYAQAIESDQEYWQDHVAPARDRVGVWQRDKLGAPRRWLRAQRGRRWDDVYADIRARFDTRTIPGHHIVFDHLLGEVDFGHVHDWRRHCRSGRRGALYIDEAGRLQLTEGPRPRYHRIVGDQTPGRLRLWTGARRVGRRGAAWYWFVRVEPRGWQPETHPVYRQLGRLQAAEVRFWESFGEAERVSLSLTFDADGRLLA